MSSNRTSPASKTLKHGYTPSANALGRKNCPGPQAAGGPRMLGRQAPERSYMEQKLVSPSLLTQDRPYLTCIFTWRTLRSHWGWTWGTGRPMQPGSGVQLPHSYFTPSFDFILYPYFFNIIEYNLFYRMYTNYITVLYRAKHELHGKNWEKNNGVLCTAKPTDFPVENIFLPTQ